LKAHLRLPLESRGRGLGPAPAGRGSGYAARGSWLNLGDPFRSFEMLYQMGKVGYTTELF